MLTDEEILGILNEWNYWDKEFEDFCYRKGYGEKLDKIRQSGEIIVFTGIRRAGKSTLMKQEIKILSEKHDKTQFLYVNFEDSRFIDNLNVQLLEKIFEVYRQNINANKEVFVFFDEIQEVENWEKYVRTIYELKKARIYLTGSSSKMLSPEISTSIAGRYIEIRVFPLTFSEFLEFKDIKADSKLNLAKNRGLIKKHFEEYLKYGGFPKVCLSDEFSKSELLLNYFDTILLKDIVARYNLKNSDSLKKTVHYILSTDSKIINLNSIRNALNISYESCSNYVSYLKEVFFISEVSNFDYSVKKQLKSNSKFYCVDTGIVNTVSFKFSENKGFLLENIVFNKLIRNYKETYYYKSLKGECDFVVKDSLKVKEAIQVCYNLNTASKKRELKGLLDAMQTFKLEDGLILTYEQEEEFKVEDKKIKVMPVWRWLLEE